MVRLMVWSIFFTWKDGTRDTLDADGISERDITIRSMKSRGEFTEISYCKKYSNGDRGELVKSL